MNAQPIKTYEPKRIVPAPGEKAVEGYVVAHEKDATREAWVLLVPTDFTWSFYHLLRIEVAAKIEVTYLPLAGPISHQELWQRHPLPK